MMKLKIKVIARWQKILLAAWIVGLFLSVSNLSLASSGGINGNVSATPEKYLAETVVYLQHVPGKYPPRTVEMDQRGLKFIPHILRITVGDTVKFLNHDHVQHNVFSPEGRYNLGVWGYGQTRSHVFDKTGVFTQLCSLHPNMLAYIFVGQNPYSAEVDASGNYRITDVAPGTYKILIWNSHLKAPPQNITIVANKNVTANFTLRR